MPMMEYECPHCGLVFQSVGFLGNPQASRSCPACQTVVAAPTAAARLFADLRHMGALAKDTS
jgi:endogenous inhibitor of DNA gyrase (YacG/DUF329 family)